MKGIIHILVLCLAVLLVPGPAFGQVDLMELKKKEEERRKNTPKSKGTVDSKTVATGTTTGKSSGFMQSETTSGGPATTPARSSRGNADASASTVSGNEQSWRNRRRALESRINAQEARVKSLEARLQAVQGAQIGYRHPLNVQRSRERVADLKIQLDLEKSKLKEARADLDRFFREARQSGVPPGWLRD